MYKFLRSVTTMTGKRFAAGAVVPDGVFGCLPEMVRAGDIAEVVEPPPAVIEAEEIEPEPAEDTEDASAKRAELARKARERRAAKRTDK